MKPLVKKRYSTRLSLCAMATAALVLGGGCDGEGSEPSAMVMQPGQSTTRPAVDQAEPPQQSDGESDAAPVYVTIDGVPYTFPPAKLYLKRQGSRVKARLLSDDPPAAVAQDWSGDSFYFEMDLELAGDGQLASLDDASAPSKVSPRELEAAEWIFHREASERSPTKSGIFLGRQSHLGGESHLQPISVSVMFDQVDEKTVMVTLEGVFADFDAAQPSERLPRRTVRVLAALPADAISY